MFVLFLSLVLNLMTVEEKVGQLCMVHFVGETANDDAKRLIDEGHVGGFILYNWANKLEDPSQVKTLTTALQKLSPSPLFIALDQEGGPVQRLRYLSLPSNKSLGITGDPHKAYTQAVAISSMLKECGINFNLAPVADISEAKGINPERCYSSDPIATAAFVKESLAAYQDQGIIATLKHFPGHGSVTVDSHIGLPVQTKILEELEKSDLIPFCQNADVIMTSHIIIKAIDPNHPVTFSPKVLQGLLREKMHFNGVIITDSVVMGGCTLSYPRLEDACKAALLAGCDILLFGGQDLQTVGRNELTTDEILNVYHFLVKAVRTGEIPESRIDEAVARVLQLKKKYG